MAHMGGVLGEGTVWPRALFAATSWTGEDAMRAAERGLRPRIDYVELARAFGSSFVHYNDLRFRERWAPRPQRTRLRRLWLEWHLARLARRRAAENGTELLVALSEGVGAWLGGRDQRWRTVTVLHHPLSPLRHPFYRLTRFAQRTDRLVFISTAERDEFTARFGLPAAKSAVILGNIDTDFYRARNAGTIAAARPFIFAFGMSKRDYATLVAAMRLLPSIDCVIAAATLFDDAPVDFGPPPLPRNVKIFTRFDLRMVHHLISQCRFVVIPLEPKLTQWAAGCTAAMVTQALGTPLIITRTPAIVEYLPASNHDLLCPAGDAGRLAELIDTLWSRPGTHADRGGEGRRHVEMHHAVRDYPARMRDVLP
jgi:glycosyltransferase involved in cell wall biosynthesis